MYLQKMKFSGSDALKDRIEKKLAELLEKVESNAAISAKGERPFLIGDDMRLYTERTHIEHQRLIEEINEELQPEATKFAVRTADDSVRKRVIQLISGLPGLEDKLREVMKKVQGIKLSPKLKNVKWVKATVMINSFVEGVLTIPLFNAWGLNQIFAALSGIGFGFVINAFVHRVGWIINLGRTVWQKRIIGIAIAIALFAFFYYFAELRAEYLSAVLQKEGLTVHYPALPFALISMLLIATSIALEQSKMPSDQEIAVKDEYDAITAEIATIKGEIDSINEQANSLDNEKDGFKLTSASMIEFGASLEQLVIHHSKLCYLRFQEVNFQNRSDGRPDCFGIEYPYAFQTYFQNYFNSNRANS